MSYGFYAFGLCAFTYGTGVGFNTLCGTCCFLGYNATIVAVRFFSNGFLCRDYCVTYGTLLAIGETFLGAGCGFTLDSGCGVGMDSRNVEELSTNFLSKGFGS